MATKAMTLSEMRTYVRDFLDTDSTDLTDAIVDRFLIEGSNRIESFSDHWKFRMVEEDFSTVAGTQHYVFSNEDGQTRNAGFSANILRIYDLRSPTLSLKPEAHQAMRQQYLASTAAIPAQTTSQGSPSRFTTWKFRIYLWPIPSAAQTFTLNGYREGIDWVGTSVAPDFPAEFHELVTSFAIARAYDREGDPGMSAKIMAEFYDELKVRATSYIIDGDSGPLILNGGTTSRHYPRTPAGRLLYDWE